MRLFAAIRPPDGVLDHLESALVALGDLPPAPETGRGRRRPNRRAALRSPWTPRENWHITLTFFGEVPAGAVPELGGALGEAASAVEPFELGLTGAGTFRGTTTWIGVGGETEPLAHLMTVLADLRETIAGRAEQQVRNRAHLTVSRAGGTFDTAHAAHVLSIYRGPEWEVDEIDLVESDLGAGPRGGARHTVLDTFPLGHHLPTRSESWG